MAERPRRRNPVAVAVRAMTGRREVEWYGTALLATGIPVLMAGVMGLLLVVQGDDALPFALRCLVVGAVLTAASLGLRSYYRRAYEGGGAGK
ncbi:hypothetical protein ACFPZ0_05890 [Streptomonospora nanhaiensis]|uniref:Flp pilus assembly protein protease CpaA n=1 Tax=Streptomonospora nanhaiensis TaxID=1323731 RepID=A0A853BVN1_9ACTN|nr:hypothetical protein [Streptomonospora nanhaiensis]MBX9388044.1 hypothetical protein [Streptomonospora nanhaiensis]NYI99143.1 Flp pilus assembly protein protease CpaA [Streptomonospora nanhaiensis]